MQHRFEFSSRAAQPVLVVGSVAYDTVVTPKETGEYLLGGAASFAALAASYFVPTRLVGAVGNDFKEEYITSFKEHGVDLEGLQVDSSAKTFFWKGEYLDRFARRETHQTDLNVFEHFRPELPASYKSTPFLMLGNIGPDLQGYVLEQMEAKPFVVMDTIELWIKTARQSLMQVIAQVDLIVINEEEALELTDTYNPYDAAKALLQSGPEWVIIKKGEYGAMLCSASELFLLPAYPVTELHDPTGAGDSFAGALIGFLAAHARTDLVALKHAMLYASATASFTIEGFSCDRLREAGKLAIQQRVDELRQWTTLEPMS